MSKCMMTNEQMAAAVARVKELDAKRHKPEPIMFSLTTNGFGLKFAQLCTKEECLDFKSSDKEEVEKWQACVDFYGIDSAALIAQLWDEREKNRAVMVQARDALENGIKSQCYCDEKLNCVSHKALAALNDALGGE